MEEKIGLERQVSRHKHAVAEIMWEESQKQRGEFVSGHSGKIWGAYQFSLGNTYHFTVLLLYGHSAKSSIAQEERLATSAN